MKNMLAYVFAVAGITLVALQAQAESLVEGSADAGKSKSVTCAACHGAAGISANPLWPNVAGQNAPYLLTQLKAFKGGSRENPLMTSQAVMLSDQDMADLAVYFESLPGPAQAVADPDLISKGEALYRGGNVENQVAACIACHGPTGAGNPAAYDDVLDWMSARMKGYFGLETIASLKIPRTTHEPVLTDSHPQIQQARELGASLRG